MQPKEYAYYNRHDELVATGTKKELSEKLGVTVGTLGLYMSPSYRKRAEKGIRVIPITDYPERVKNVDIKRIRLLMEDGGYKHKDLAEVLDISYASIKKRLIGAVTFTADEIETLEDLFFLDEGELIKE
jgi:hypothetical protein